MATKLTCRRAFAPVILKRTFAWAQPRNGVENPNESRAKTAPGRPWNGDQLYLRLQKIAKQPFPRTNPHSFQSSYITKKRHTRNLIVYKAPESPLKRCTDPISTVHASQISLLDPTGARTRLFSKTNPECARVGDILLVRMRTGDPFSGVCINIRRRGVDTAILLRGQLTRVGVEMWYKIYSPLVEGIEVVQRVAKRARRARLTYMRKEKHDRGDVSNVVRMYLRQKAALGIGGAKGGKRVGGLGPVGGKKSGKGKKK
ncbi:uncharacterized protein BDR25DRAFT_291368 [Lindgomyces ingoldianus]|uniref:Uncharacterized protein n=1 Tax=Lindgomyces ingoldianus TaxID=673940 RepID=A0ACB6QLR2_9PLEO|nr:uncharacterized protein BDR25DRAFT_291368 [Lindgomyces ingoldianus]KAF2467919.1 hypothetical protein BDR25DRAFT_291368 [Lindgomyces ingoldianus]